jgi:YfiH family protein
MVMTWPRQRLQGNASFQWQRAPWGEVLVCEPLAAVAPHAFTTRALDVGPNGEDLQRGYAALAGWLAVPVSRLHDARQVHEAGVHVAVGERRHGLRPEADVLMAIEPETGVVIRVADCVPILTADRVTGAVAAIHAGWRGVRAEAAMTAVRELETRFGARPRDLVAAIGPSIGACCYQVDVKVWDAFAAPGRRLPPRDSWFRRDGTGHWRLDLWTATRDQLLAAGLSAESIHTAGECTASRTERYYSYRVEGARAGRLLAAIRT